MDILMSIGVFFGGFGLMLLSFSAFWYTSIYKEVRDQVRLDKDLNN